MEHLRLHLPDKGGNKTHPGSVVSGSHGESVKENWWDKGIGFDVSRSMSVGKGEVEASKKIASSELEGHSVSWLTVSIPDFGDLSIP